MGETAASIVVPASLTDAWKHYFDPVGWPAWVDGFASVLSAEGYPEPAGTLRWASVAAGRGEVTETVLEHTPPRLHRISFSDPESEGELLTRFEIEPGAGNGQEAPSRITLELSYQLRNSGFLGGIVDLLFVRSQMRGSLARSLGRFRLEIEDRAA